MASSQGRFDRKASFLSPTDDPSPRKIQERADTRVSAAQRETKTLQNTLNQLSNPNFEAILEQFKPKSNPLLTQAANIQAQNVIQSSKIFQGILPTLQQQFANPSAFLGDLFGAAGRKETSAIQGVRDVFSRSNERADELLNARGAFRSTAQREQAALSAAEEGKTVAGISAETDIFIEQAKRSLQASALSAILGGGQQAGTFVQQEAERNRLSSQFGATLAFQIESTRQNNALKLKALEAANKDDGGCTFSLLLGGIGAVVGGIAGAGPFSVAGAGLGFGIGSAAGSIFDNS